MKSPAGHGLKFSRKKEAAIQALCTQRNLEEAARAAGISKQTLKRWLKLPEIKEAFREARRQMVSQSNARIQQASGAALSTLVKIMVDPSASKTARVRAGDRILDGAHRAIEFEDTQARLSALERIVKKS